MITDTELFDLLKKVEKKVDELQIGDIFKAHDNLFQITKISPRGAYLEIESETSWGEVHTTALRREEKVFILSSEIFYKKE